MSDPLKIQLKNVRIGYPALFRPKAFGKGAAASDPAYQASFYLDKEDKLHKKFIEQIKDAIDLAKEGKWGNKIPKIGSDKICLKDGDKLEEPAPEEEGHYILSARNKKKPLVIDLDKTELVEADGRPYGGCYVDAIVRIWAQDNEFGKRINCSLEAVRYRDKGEAFGAAPVSADEFDDEDDLPPRRERSRRAEPDDDEDRPSRNSRSRRDADEDEDERPSRRRNRDEDDEDERPSRRRSRDEDGDDEDRPSRNSRSRNRDEDEDERPARRSRRDHDDV